MLTKLEITGFRGFASKQTIRLAVPNGNPGSGLTVVVGSNNAGKSTTIESLRAVAQMQNPSFSQGRRNQKADDKVEIRVAGPDGRARTLRSIRAGSSETEVAIEGDGIDIATLLVLPSRRVFDPYFARSESNRNVYMSQIGFPANRSSSLDSFAYRLFTIEKNRNAFDEVLKEVLDPVPNWSIDQFDTGQYFLKIRKGDATHSSEGLGEGLVSLLYIVDALYDSRAGDTIAIDEPELSLHPALQRKLSALLLKYADSRQIVLATHSPYFARLDSLPNGGTVARVHLVNNDSTISQLSSPAATDVAGLMTNQNNPHIFGLDAQEIFFIEDRVILVEGQEDVVFFGRVQDALGITLSGTFYGWGVGGADNMRKVAAVLHDLGYSKVVGILDSNRAELIDGLTHQFPRYHFLSIPAADVRSKRAVPEKQSVQGLLDDDNTNVRPEFVERTRVLLREANRYFTE